MNLKIFLLFIITITGGLVMAQGPDNRPAIVWQKCFGGSDNDKGNDVIITKDGGILVVGNSRSNDGDVSGHNGPADLIDGWALKLDAAANIQWQRSLGGSGEDDLTSVITAGDSVYYCIGYSNSTDDGLPPEPSPVKKAWVIKLSASGDIVWSKTYVQSSEPVNGLALSDGNIVIAGGNFIFKIDPAGDVLWQHDFSLGNSIIENSDHRLITSGGYSLDIATGDISDLHWELPPESYATSIANSGNTIFMAYNQQINNEICFGGSGIEPGTNVVNNVGYFNNSDITGMISEQTYLSECVDGGRYGGAIVSAAPQHGLSTFGNSFITAGNLYTVYWEPKAIACVYTGGVFSFYGAPRVEINWTEFRSVKVYPSGDEFICVGHTNTNGGDVSGMHGFEGSFTTDVWVVKLARLTATWTGAIDEAWENPGNWSTNLVPDKATKVVIPGDRPRYPVVNSNATCYRLQADNGTSVTVNTGFNLEIAGK